jgi:hypothetical protein
VFKHSLPCRISRSTPPMSAERPPAEFAMIDSRDGTGEKQREGPNELARIIGKKGGAGGIT